MITRPGRAGDRGAGPVGGGVRPDGYTHTFTGWNGDRPLFVIDVASRSPRRRIDAAAGRAVHVSGRTHVNRRKRRDAAGSQSSHLRP
jgi:hypothetical protein